MKELIYQLIGCFFGVVGFCLVFKLQKRHILTSTIGALIGWVIYLLTTKIGLNIVWASFLSTLFCEIYAELMAIIKKAPAIVFLIPCIFPLIPGGSLFHMTYNLSDKNYELAKFYGIQTIQYVFAIAAGISIAWYLFNSVHTFIKKVK